MGSLVLSAEYSDTMSHMASHFHDCHQLIYLAKGQAVFTVSGREYHACDGTLVLISRFEAHSIQVKSDCYQRYTLRISPEMSHPDSALAEPLFALLVNRPQNFQHAIHLSPHLGVQRLLQAILKEITHPDSFSDKMVSTMLLQLLICVYRTDPSMINNAESDLHLIRQIQVQFETDYASKYTLEMLSQQYHISPSYLSHLFKKVTGSSVMGYLSSCRFAAAKRYLADTALEISRIVELCGFSDSSNFSRSFKALTGQTPSGFRSHFRKADTPYSIKDTLKPDNL